MEGEDLIILDNLKNIKNGFYVDAGCYHPLHLNNTHLLYKRGWSGINVDLSEYTIDLFNYLRPDDHNINVAVSNYDCNIKFYYQKTLSQITSVKKELATKNARRNKRKKIKANKLDTILENSKFKNQRIDLLNIDVEGGTLKQYAHLTLIFINPTHMH